MYTKVGIWLLLSFPLNAVYKRLPDDGIRLKSWYIISVSLILLKTFFGVFRGIAPLLISTLFTYFLTKFNRSKYMPCVNFVVCMAYLALNHIRAQYFGDENVYAITGAQMVLVMKLTSFAWSYYDGAESHLEKLNNHSRRYMIVKHPDLVRFIAYALFYPTLLTGPTCEFADFDDWLTCKIFSGLPEDKKLNKNSGGKYPARKIPYSGYDAMIMASKGIIWLALTVVLTSIIDVDYLDTADFKEKSFFIKIHMLYFLGFTMRLKYYAAWVIAEASCVECGLDFLEYDEKEKKIIWGRVCNVDPIKFELAQNAKSCLDAWNKGTNKWLKNHVFLRAVPLGKEPGFRPALLTFATSAFWHGIRPGYYLSFISAAFFQTVGKIYRRNFRPLFLQRDGVSPKRSKIFYDIFTFWATQLAFGYMVQPFLILDLKKSLECWREVYYYVHVVIIVTLVVFKGPFGKRVSAFLNRYKLSKQPKK
ncbi:HCL037Wp [Eremothecium sinecaudum]|uniref:HCL037Wp n=1 Tax=Eremothecium sinecaudum TaxID=45286 RepID=A0A0X8HRH7_9SACH|nr:HCL037Wp [Eremothecium sinecaudum]AMD20114.1 HCL037Wp [Eremothecium sinecaudum]